MSRIINPLYIALLNLTFALLPSTHIVFILKRINNSGTSFFIRHLIYMIRVFFFYNCRLRNISHPDKMFRSVNVIRIYGD